MIPGPIPSSQCPAPWTALVLDGITHYADRSAYLAAHPGAILPYCDPSSPVCDFDPATIPAEFRGPTGGFGQVNLGTGLVVEIHATLNLPNDADTFPAWTGNGTTSATWTATGNPQVNAVQSADLCTLAEAARVVAMLNASGYTASAPADASINPQSGYYPNANWLANGATESRRPWTTVVNGTLYMCAWIYAVMTDKSGGKVAGVGAPGTLKLDGTNRWVFTPQPAPVTKIAEPCRFLVAPEILARSSSSPMAGVQLTRSDLAQAAGTDAGTKAELDQVLAEEKTIEGEEKKIENALGIE